MDQEEEDITINDTIYGWVTLKKCELKIINTPIFQRLRGIKQLSVVHYVFPGANHSRFEHSIGVLHICSKYAKHIYPNNKRKQQVIRIAALLHDIGHGAFSHCWDRVVYSKIYNGVEKGHDMHRFEIIRELLKDEIESCGITIEEIENVWNGNDRISKAIVNGPVGGDRLDFMKRDSHFCGTLHFGTAAVDRIIICSGITEIDGKECLYYKEKVIEDIIQALLGRSAMYRQIYWHHTVSGATLLIEEAIKLALPHLHYIERTLDLNEFVNITDDFIIGEIMTSKKEELKQSQLLLSRLKTRDIPKLVYTCYFTQSEIRKRNLWTTMKEYAMFEFNLTYRFNFETLVMDNEKILNTINIYEFDKNHIVFKTKSGIYQSINKILIELPHLKHYTNIEDVFMFRFYLDSYEKDNIVNK
jgi:HD superfamily phosphohydrolase